MVGRNGACEMASQLWCRYALEHLQSLQEDPAESDFHGENETFYSWGPFSSSIDVFTTSVKDVFNPTPPPFESEESFEFQADTMMATEDSKDDAESDAEESEVWTAWPLRDLPSHLLLAAGVTSFWRGAWYVLDVAVFPDSALLSGGATLGLGWGGFALLRKFAGSSHQPPPRPESLAPSFCLRWQSNLRYPPPAPARRELRWSLSVSARPPRLRRLRARAGHHGAPRGGRVQPSAAHLRRVSHRALGSLLLAGGLGALGRAIRGDERRARRAGLGSHLALRRGGCVNSRRSFHSNARPARTDRDASRLEASGAVR